VEATQQTQRVGTQGAARRQRRAHGREPRRRKGVATAAISVCEKATKMVGEPREHTTGHGEELVRWLGRWTPSWVLNHAGIFKAGITKDTDIE